LPRELKNATITHVSYVDKGANQKKFFLTKADKKPTFEKQIKILTKAADTQRLVYGVVYEPDVWDSQGDFMTAVEIEKSAHVFMKDARNIDLQHNFEKGYGDVVESYIAPQDFEVGDETIKKGSWVLVTKASEEVWESIQKGEITGYSMAGIAETVQKQSEPLQDDNLMRGFFNAMKSFFTGEKVQKGVVADKYNKNKKNREFWAVQDALNSVLFRWDFWEGGMEIDPNTIREALQDFVTIAEQVLISEDIIKAIGPPPEHIAKAGKKISAARLDRLRNAHEALGEILVEVDEKEETEVNKQDIEAMINKALEPIASKLEALEKGDNPLDNPKTDPVNDVTKQFTEALEKALQPINERLENVEKVRGISKQADVDGQNQEPVKKHYLTGIL
jgi:hypothetical protein